MNENAVYLSTRLWRYCCKAICGIQDPGAFPHLTLKGIDYIHASLFIELINKRVGILICSCGMTSTEECAAIFNTILVKEFGDYRYGRVHRLTVDAFSLQHPDKYMASAKSYAAHLGGMCVAMEFDNSPRLLMALQQWLNGNRQITRPDLPASYGKLTIAHIPGASDGTEHSARVKQWAAAAWQAYSNNHGLAKGWIAEIGTKASEP